MHLSVGKANPQTDSQDYVVSLSHFGTVARRLTVTQRGTAHADRRTRRDETRRDWADGSHFIRHHDSFYFTCIFDTAKDIAGGQLPQHWTRKGVWNFTRPGHEIWDRLAKLGAKSGYVFYAFGSTSSRLLVEHGAGFRRPAEQTLALLRGCVLLLDFSTKVNGRCFVQYNIRCHTDTLRRAFAWEPHRSCSTRIFMLDGHVWLVKAHRCTPRVTITACSPFCVTATQAVASGQLNSQSGHPLFAVQISPSLGGCKRRWHVPHGQLATADRAEARGERRVAPPPHYET